MNIPPSDHEGVDFSKMPETPATVQTDPVEQGRISGWLQLDSPRNSPRYQVVILVILIAALIGVLAWYMLDHRPNNNAPLNPSGPLYESRNIKR